MKHSKPLNRLGGPRYLMVGKLPVSERDRAGPSGETRTGGRALGSTIHALPRHRGSRSLSLSFQQRQVMDSVSRFRSESSNREETETGTGLVGRLARLGVGRNLWNDPAVAGPVGGVGIGSAMSKARWTDAAGRSCATRASPSVRPPGRHLPQAIEDSGGRVHTNTIRIHDQVAIDCRDHSHR